MISFFIFLFFVAPAYAAGDKKVYISGDVLNVTNKGELIVSEGNSKAISENNTLKSKQMVYSKTENKISVLGNVEIYMQSDDGEPVEAFGDRGFYYTDKKTGQLYSDSSGRVQVKYFMNNSSAPVMMNSQEIYLDAQSNTIKALKNVEIITSSGTIYSDNAFFSRDKNSILINRDIKRPVADIVYEDKKGKFESDIMLFERADGKNKIKMRGKVEGKIKVEEENKESDETQIEQTEQVETENPSEIEFEIDIDIDEEK